MNIQFTGLHKQPSDELRQHIAEKFERLGKLAGGDIISTHVACHIDNKMHAIDASLNIPGTTISARSESEDMYKSVDLLVDKLAAQLTKHKEKMRDHR